MAVVAPAPRMRPRVRCYFERPVFSLTRSRVSLGIAGATATFGAIVVVSGGQLPRPSPRTQSYVDDSVSIGASGQQKTIQAAIQSAESYAQHL